MRVLMHESPTATYPRPAGVVVPKILVRAGCLAPVDSEGRLRAAAATVDWVRESLRHLPPEVLETTLPDPGSMLRSWSLSARTRGALSRLGAPGPRREWRVRDLVGAARFGPAALVDLLA